MTKNHARHNARKREQRATGAAYASAAAGATHQHRSLDMEPIDGTLFGRPGPVDMRPMGLLLGACAEGCQPCQKTLIDRVLDSDRLPIASIAGLMMQALPAPPGDTYSDPTRTFYPLAKDLTVDGLHAAIAYLDALDRTDLADLLDDALDISAGLITVLTAGKGDPEPDPAPATDAVTPAAPSRHSVAGSMIAYRVTPGFDLYFAADDITNLLQQTEATASSGQPLKCGLCDEPIDMAIAPQINLGLMYTLADPDGPGVDVFMPVWTHPACGAPRVWTMLQINAARQERGLTIWGPDPTEAPQPEDREDDWYLPSLVNIDGKAYPLVAVQLGLPNRFGTLGHVTDMVSMGLRPVDLLRGEASEVPDWLIHIDRGRITKITRRGAGAWWTAAPGVGSTDPRWKTVGKARRTALVVILPPRWWTDDAADGQALSADLERASAANVALGGFMEIRGTFS